MRTLPTAYNYQPPPLLPLISRTTLPERRLLVAAGGDGRWRDLVDGSSSPKESARTSREPVCCERRAAAGQIRHMAAPPPARNNNPKAVRVPPPPSSRHGVGIATVATVATVARPPVVPALMGPHNVIPVMGLPELGVIVFVGLASWALVDKLKNDYLDFGPKGR